MFRPLPVDNQAMLPTIGSIVNSWMIGCKSGRGGWGNIMQYLCLWNHGTGGILVLKVGCEGAMILASAYGTLQWCHLSASRCCLDTAVDFRLWHLPKEAHHLMLSASFCWTIWNRKSHCGHGHARNWGCGSNQCRVTLWHLRQCWTAPDM